MDINSLAQRLRDADPRVRVEVLRILAMVEETRALPAIRWIFQHDPEPGVREVANWAGHLLWEAHQRGHSTQRALEEIFDRPLSPEREKRFLASMDFGAPVTRHLATYRYATEQAFERQLDDLFRSAAERNQQEDDAFPALPAPEADDDSWPENL
jgi:hypothetical protein